MTVAEMNQLEKINQVEQRLLTVKGVAHNDLAKYLKRLRSELRVYRSFRGNAR